MTPQLSTKYVFSLAIRIGTPILAGEIGWGMRRIIPILGGEVTGPSMRGTIFPCGADFQVIRPNGFTELEAKYAFKLDDGAIVYIENIGIRFGPKEALDRIARGETVDPSLIYFRSVPRFETGSENYRWLMEHLFIGSGARHPDRVEIDVHQVM
ncbi:MAG TPA: DUF3237 domain-containing protein [Bradyrhizobium sp.]|nr:DUF3237 domain-containing protein [Bradyrhizobium sp.]